MGEKTGGFFLVALVLGVTGDIGFWHFVPGCSYSPIGGTDNVESLMFYQLLAAKSLKRKGMKVYLLFEKQDTRGRPLCGVHDRGKRYKPLSPSGH